MERVCLDREKSEKLFYEMRELGIFLAQSLNGVVQNPDFATIGDLDNFKEECKRFEDRYNNIKLEVEHLFENAKAK